MRRLALVDELEAKLAEVAGKAQEFKNGMTFWQARAETLHAEASERESKKPARSPRERSAKMKMMMLVLMTVMTMTMVSLALLLLFLLLFLLSVVVSEKEVMVTIMVTSFLMRTMPFMPIFVI